MSADAQRIERAKAKHAAQRAARRARPHDHRPEAVGICGACLRALPVSALTLAEDSKGLHYRCADCSTVRRFAQRGAAGQR